MSIAPLPDRARFVTRPRPVATPPAQAIPAAPKTGILVRLLCIFFIIFDFPGFTMQLAMDAGGVDNTTLILIEVL